MNCRYQECHQPAAYTTPLGTPYCAEHGVCRCGRTVAEFVPYYDTVYVCPCIVAFAQAAAREQELKAMRQEVLL